MSTKDSVRKKKAFINILFSFALELINIIAGLIVPRLIIASFGSDVNGLVNSIANFLGYITLLQSGAGSVIRVALYKPLAKKNHEELCVVVRTAEKFFRNIAYFTVAYIVILAVLFPTVITPEYEFWYSATLVAVIGLSTAAQYFFGISYQMLLEADQRSHIFSAVQIGTVILNTVATVILVRLGCSIQLVKAVSAIFFVLRPLCINLYAKRHYRIDTSVRPNNALIAQRWDGLAQALAYFAHTKAPVFSITLFSSLKNVSVYSVYSLITTGLTSFISCIDKAMKALIGNVIADGEEGKLKRVFNSYQTLMHMLASACFATACITVGRFIGVYTSGITDAEYNQPLFAFLIITAECLYCLRLPYNTVVTASGKFKEIKVPAYIEVGINVVLSCLLVQFLGLNGVAISTIVAMGYRTISFVFFLRRNILHLTIVQQLLRYAVTFVGYILCIGICSRVPVEVSGYVTWAIYAILVFAACSVIVLVLNLLFLRRATVGALKSLLPSRRKRIQ